MKKLLAMLLCLALCFAFVGCGPTDDGAGDDLVSGGDGDAVAADGSLLVEVTGHEIVKDADGVDAIVVKIKYTNETAQPQNFKLGVRYSLTQNGAELTTAPLTDDSPYLEMVTNGQKKAATGETIEVAMAYVLNDTTTPVKITLTPKKGADKTPIEKEITL